MATISLEQVAAELKKIRSAIVASHISPDPDALGSAGALTLALRELGVETVCYFEDTVPEKLRTLFEPVKIVHALPQQKVDLVIIVDTSTRARVGRSGEQLFALGKRTLCIDHHISNEGWADLNHIDGAAAATAEILEALFGKLGSIKNTAIPNLLYSGLLDDTGSFRFGNTDAAAFECASRLVRAGADPMKVANELYAQVPLRVFRLRERVHATLELHHGGRFALVNVPRTTLQETGSTEEDTEGLIDDIRALDGTVVVALIRELDDAWKVSLRSKRDEIDVNSFAGKFGGGGHRAAAGCRIVGSLNDVKKQLIDGVAAVLK